MNFLLLTFFATVVSQLPQHCVNDLYYCYSSQYNYVIANKNDCSRFVQCSTNGRATYMQCRRNFIFDYCIQKCIQAQPGPEARQCFNASLPGCVVEKLKPFDPYQAPPPSTATSYQYPISFSENIATNEIDIKVRQPTYGNYPTQLLITLYPNNAQIVQPIIGSTLLPGFPQNTYINAVPVTPCVPLPAIRNTTTLPPIDGPEIPYN